MSVLPALLAAILTGAAVALTVPAVPAARSAAAVRRVEAAAALPVAVGAPDVHDEPDDLVSRHRLLISFAAAFAPVLLIGGPVGVVAGVLAGVLVHRALGAREPARARRRREQVARSLPLAVDLLAVALAAGASPSAALRAVAGAVQGPLSEDLLVVEHSLDLGRDPVRVWRELSQRPGLAALGRSMARAVETGASVSEALHRLAEDLAETGRADAETRARSVGVHAAAPLGLCLLPAFVLMGVVPLVAGSVGVLFTR